MEFFDLWYVKVGIVLILLAAGFKWILWLFGVIFIPDDSIGVVTKRFVLLGSQRNLPDGRI
ncbi:MAG: hypothetical protein ACXVCP_20050, partial [Bdellovibrio sp.]